MSDDPPWSKNGLQMRDVHLLRSDHKEDGVPLTRTRVDARRTCKSCDLDNENGCCQSVNRARVTPVLMLVRSPSFSLKEIKPKVEPSTMGRDDSKSHKPKLLPAVFLSSGALHLVNGRFNISKHIAGHLDIEDSLSAQEENLTCPETVSSGDILFLSLVSFQTFLVTEHQSLLSQGGGDGTSGLPTLKFWHVSQGCNRSNLRVFVWTINHWGDNWRGTKNDSNSDGQWLKMVLHFRLSSKEKSHVTMRPQRWRLGITATSLLFKVLLKVIKCYDFQGIMSKLSHWHFLWAF